MSKKGKSFAVASGILAVLLGRSAAAAAEEQWRAPADSGQTLRSIVTGIRADALAPVAGSGSSGWPQAVGGGAASPIFYDLDRDGRLEVLLPDDGFMRVYDAVGIPFAGWPRAVNAFSQMHAAVADLDGDGSDEIVVAFASDPPAVYVSDLHGNLKPGWPALLPYQVFLNVTSPVVADLDRDGSLDVGVAAEKGVFFFHADGTPLPGWPYLWAVPVNNPQWSAPAVADLDGDGFLEVVVGNVSYPDWGVHVISHDGKAVPGWPKVTAPIWSSPAIADLDGDGDREIIVQEGDYGSVGTRMWVWEPDGTVFPGWPRVVATEGNSSRSAPAIADLDGDGTLEIVSATSDGILHILRRNGTDYPGFPIDTGGVAVIASPSVIDVNGDGLEEVFLTYYSSIIPYSQDVSGWRLDGTLVPGFPKQIHSFTDSAAAASVHLADIDGDGELDLTTQGVSSIYGGQLWVLEVPGSIVPPATRSDWPKIRRDARNTGCFCTERCDDIDHDGVCDVTDNCVCPNLSCSNPDQADSDHDGQGDVCDTCPNDPLNDADHDEVCGDVDGCESSGLGPTATVGNCDSGVPNTMIPPGSGCMLQDLVNHCGVGARNHGAFVSCVSHLAGELNRQGFLTGRQKGRLQQCAGRS